MNPDFKHYDSIADILHADINQISKTANKTTLLNKIYPETERKGVQKIGKTIFYPVFIFNYAYGRWLVLLVHPFCLSY